MPDRWFEDYVPGTVYRLEPVTVTEQEILDFARAYDPQPFHTDPTSAAAAPFGGVIASGWHTCGLVTRAMVASYLSPVSSLASPAMDELRWLAPVRPGDTLTATVTVRETRCSVSKPDRGIVRSAVEVTNQHGAIVLTMLGVNLIRVRPS